MKTYSKDTIYQCNEHGDSSHTTQLFKSMQDTFDANRISSI